MSFSMPSGCARFARNCGKMYSRHLFSAVKSSHHRFLKNSLLRVLIEIQIQITECQTLNEDLIRLSEIVIT